VIKLTIPYKVTVTGKDNDMNVVIRPQPIATKEEYITVVSGRFQKALMDSGIRNTVSGRAKLKKELESILADYHSQGLIQPKKEKDEGI
jgi:hypothetical protein